jgi:hypothetical protein
VRQVTQTRYDAARTAAGHPDAPTAAQTARRFRLPWQVLLPRALNARDLNRFLGANRAEEDADWLDNEELTRALRTVASVLRQPTLTPWGYDRAVHELLSRKRRAWRHRAPPRLPSSVQIITYCKTWAAALKLRRVASDDSPPA